MTTTISDGTPPPEPPAGDPVAQAVASLRGYAYQLYASGLAWRDLKPGEELYLEVAEDYAVATGEALRAVQVRNTTETVTLNAEGARSSGSSLAQRSARDRTPASRWSPRGPSG